MASWYRPRRRALALTLAAASCIVVHGCANDGVQESDTTDQRQEPTVDEEGLRSSLRQDENVDVDEYTFEFGPSVPGVIVFTAYRSGVPHSNITGAYDGTLHFDVDEAVTLVLSSLGFGDGEVDPAVVAGTVGMLQANPGTPYLTADAIDLGGDPSVMTPPRSIVVDGRPAVEFWNKSSRERPWRVTVVAEADGTFRVVNGV